MTNDHRVVVTKRMIEKSFIEILKTKPIGNITVKEICEKACINRATFYAHYNNVYCLMDEIKNSFSQSIMESVVSFSNSDSIIDFFNEICNCIYENAEASEVIFGANGDSSFALNIVELIRSRYVDLWKEAGGKNNNQLELLYTFVAYGGLAVIRYWIQNGLKQKPEEIAAFIVKYTKSNLTSY